MSLLSEYDIDDSVTVWGDVKREVRKLTKEEVDEILSRRRQRSDPSSIWKMWQNGLKWWQNVLIGKQGTDSKVESIVEDFAPVKEAMENYGYLEVDDVEVLYNIVNRLLDIVRSD